MITARLLKQYPVALWWLPVQLGLLSPCLCAAPLSIEIHGPYPDGRIAVKGRLESELESEFSWNRLLGSTDLKTWTPLAQFQGSFDFLDPHTPEHPKRFYRLYYWYPSGTLDEPQWKNQIRYVSDPFSSDATGWIAFRWIKFIILTEEPWRVYFQRTLFTPFHYEFARANFPQFASMSLEEFNQVTLYPGPEQKAVLGAVVFPPPAASTNEFGIQLVGVTPYPPEQVKQVIEAVSLAVLPRTAHAFYMPVFEQQAAALEAAKFFKENGVVLGSVERWVPGDVCYSIGWAQGRLVFVAASEISSAYASGQLSNEHILVTDAVPAELPFVQGIITLSPATPNSHVAILANSYRQPFAYLQSNRTNELFELLGREILFLARAQRKESVQWTSAGSTIRLIDLEGQLDERARAELADMKDPPPLRVAAKQPYGRWSASAEDLTPADIQYCGGKAANYGFLRRSVSDHSEEAIAFSFDLWDAFMDQTLPSGNTLRNEIAERMSRHQYPPNVLALRADLEAIQTLITRVASFNLPQRQGVLEALGTFDSSRRIRFRSSTNVEDLETFTGAGLYDSYSGCVLDDTDQDDLGPSRCDPDEQDERGVLRAIQKVFASFYNENAVVERLRHGVDESQVGMALLVHYSFPDEIELANGVATLENRGSFIGTLVSQMGAASVTNPQDGAQPEVMRFRTLASGTSFELEQPSELVPLGRTVLGDDYGQLVELIETVSRTYRTELNKQGPFLLDFEYKKVAPGKLVVKQVREVPLPNRQPQEIPFLANQPVRFNVMQGVIRGYQSAFTVHRLKSLWSIQTKSMRLTDTNLAESIYADVDLAYVRMDHGIQQLTGPISSWPSATNWLESDTVVDGWRLPGAVPARTLQLRVPDLKRPMSEADVPIRTLSEIPLLRLTAIYEQPVLDELGLATISEETIYLIPEAEPSSTDQFRERVFSQGNIVIETSYYVSGQLYLIHRGLPLIAFKETTIRQLASRDITLRGYFSQSYTANEFYSSDERFIFEPGLEPDLPDGIREELGAMNVRFIFVDVDKLKFMGWDGQLRDSL